MVFLILAMQHRREGGLIVFQGNVGHETQAPLIDAYQGCPVAGQPPTDAQHRSITAHHQTEIALHANRISVQCLVLRHFSCGRSMGLHGYFATLGHQELGNILENLPRPGSPGARYRILVLANQCNMAEMGCHGEITSLKS